MHRLASSFVLGYHGCDQSVADRLVQGMDFKPSDNDYDWLGPGAYFWEANPRRGLDFAEELKRQGRGDIRNPAVVGAVIDLGLCLDLLSHAGIHHFKSAHEKLVRMLNKQGGEGIPKNSPDMLKRKLDCAVVRTLHKMQLAEGNPPIDTVRAVFIEGEPVLPHSGIHEKTHIQIAVCNPDCIKGVFHVRSKFLR